MKRSIAKDKLYKAIGKGERTSHKVSYITKADGTRFRRRNANKSGDAQGGLDYVENRPNRTDFYPKDRRKKIMETGGKTPEEIAYEQEQHDAMFNSQYGKGSTVNGGGVDTELKEALGIADGGGVFTQDFFDKYELVKETYSTKKNPNADELAKNRKKELQEQGFLVKMRKVSFEDLARSVGYFIIAVKRKNETYAKGSTVKGVVGKLVGSYETKEKAEKMKKVFENAMSTQKGESFYIKKIQSPKSELKYDLLKVKGYGKGGKTPEEAYEQEQNDAMYDSTYGKGGKTGCWCYEIGGL
jgi:hypothetical protein